MYIAWEKYLIYSETQKYKKLTNMKPGIYCRRTGKRGEGGLREESCNFLHLIKR